MSFLRFLETLRNPVCDNFFLLITYLGDETVFMAIALFIYWCIDKYRGYLVLSVSYIGTLINQSLKILFRIPRPWVLDEGFTVVPEALDRALGYSFPSGHTQNAVGCYGAVGVTSKRKITKIICAALMILIPFSRLYLGVHTPLDVAVPFVLAILLIAVMKPATDHFRQRPEHMNFLLWGLLAASAAYLIYITNYKFPTDIDTQNLISGTKNGYVLFGGIAALCVAYPIEIRFIKFKEKAPIPAQICKLVLGFASMLTIRAGLKELFAVIFGSDALFPDAIRYFIIVLFATLVWPLTFPFFTKLFSVNEETGERIVSRKRLFAFFLALILILPAVFFAVSLSDFQIIDSSAPDTSDPVHPIAPLAYLIVVLFSAIIGILFVMISVICAAAGIVLSLVNTSKEKVGYRPLRIVSWCLFGIHSGTILLVLILLFM